jgi:hypothetical protein
MALGKAKEVTAAIAKGIDDAKKNLVKVPVLKVQFRTNSTESIAVRSCSSSLPRPVQVLSPVVPCVQYSKVLVLRMFWPNQKARPTPTQL